MPRGVPLSGLVLQLRAEIGKSTDVTVGLQDLPNLQQILRRTQQTLYDEFDWPKIFGTWRDISLQKNLRYYDFPSDMLPENVTGAAVKWSGIWTPVKYGIETDNYNQLDPNQMAATGSFVITGGAAGGGNQITSVTVNGVDVLGAPVLWATSGQATAAAVAAQINSYLSYPEYTATSDGLQVIISAAEKEGSTPNTFVVLPTVGGDVTVSNIVDMTGGVSARLNDPLVMWQVVDNGDVPQIEVWPVPASDGSVLRLTGMRNLRPLVADTDVADLDDALIVLFAAAEKMAGKKDGTAKANAAIARLNALRAKTSDRSSFRIGENYDHRTERHGTVIRISGVSSSSK